MSEIRRGQNLALGIIAFVLGATVLYVAKPVFLPLVLAIFLAIILQPALRWLQRFFPGWLALAFVLVAMALLAVGVSVLILLNVEAIVAKAPVYSQRFQEMFAGVGSWLEDLGVDWRAITSGEGLSRAFRFLASSLESAASAAGQFALVLLLLVFLLIEARQFSRKCAEAFSPGRHEALLETLERVSARVQQYMSTKTLISLATATVTGVVLWIIGIDFAFLWGFLTFLLNYIPNVGSIIAIGPPVLIGLLQYPTPTRAIVALALLIAIQTVLGNVVEPRLMGRSLNLSPFVVLLSMLLWGWLWGLIGVVLAVPLTATIQIICRHTERFRPIAVLLSDLKVDTKPATRSENTPK